MSLSFNEQKYLARLHFERCFLPSLCDKNDYDTHHTNTHTFRSIHTHLYTHTPDCDAVANLFVSSAC